MWGRACRSPKLKQFLLPEAQRLASAAPTKGSSVATGTDLDPSCEFTQTPSTTPHRLRAETSAAMPIPFETLIPYGIIVAMFGVTGAGLSKIKNMQNGGKRTRRGIDQWDKQSRNHNALEPGCDFADGYGIVMDRDRRLTGYLRGQANNPEAPAGFELSSGWKVEKRMS